MGEGFSKGEICNRNNCDGTIMNKGKDGSCSCHIHPPCGYCETPDEYCPKCGWDSLEEKEEYKLEISNSDWWKEQIKNNEKRKNKLHAQMRGELPVTEFDYESLSHTHFSMIKQGVYPDNMTINEVRIKVGGTFGGRFEYFDNNKFKFIAYID